MSWAMPHNSHRTAQAAYRAKIFRDIFQKCSPSHQGLAALFASSNKKFSGALHHPELCGIALTFPIVAKRSALEKPFCRNFAPSLSKLSTAGGRFSVPSARAGGKGQKIFALPH
ncbi:hypothetical protein [Allofournierella massiliensis]|uniref:Uncharacterized protein n=1 Tax=Allofournierella massiliensis TaxID=1650663 RepID=A0ABT7URJ7_9FIRM|nr:hypothetical protein [Fournierella massiliensis]MDM8201507.1 hypothetical protein [Fournierella massiliensis]